MKRLSNAVFKKLDGEDATTTQNGSDIPLTTKYAILPHINATQEVGERSIKILELGLKISSIEGDFDYSA